MLHTLSANAARYAGDGPVTVTARVTPTVVQVVVADRGPGVDPDQQEAIFRRGVRGRSGAERDGSGLGLSIARWLMDEQEGALAYEPRPGGGASFVITLPAAVGHDGRRPTSADRALVAVGTAIAAVALHRSGTLVTRTGSRPPAGGRPGGTPREKAPDEG